MIKIYISKSGTKTRELEFDKEEIFIGRISSNDIMLPETTVSKKHARLHMQNKHLTINDLKSANGTYVNGKKIAEPVFITSKDKINIGPFSILIDDNFLEEKCHVNVHPGALPKQQSKLTKSSQAFQAKKGPREDKKITALKRDIHKRLIESFDLRRGDIRKLEDKELYKKTENHIRQILEDVGGSLPENIDIEKLVKEILDEALGLGPIEELKDDISITEIMVNGKDQIYIERDGKLVLTDKTFSSDDAVLSVIERIVSPIGRRIDESSPLVDARLKDGSRVNAIIPPLALKGPTITIRKFFKDPLKIHDLIRLDTLNEKMAIFLKTAVIARQNIIISGGTGSGKTTTLNILSSFIPTDERIITIEDAAELQLPQDHLVSLESRPPNIEGKGQITIRDLVRNALRMRPDRIVVGECRSGEALDMLQAMNTGHDGSLTTAHANSPRDTLSRLETMVLMSGMELPLRAIREQISSALNIVVQQTRLKCGARKITHICEIAGMEGDIITMQDIFIFKTTGYDENGRTLGKYVATGMVPKFYEKLRQLGVPVDLDIFEPEEDD